MRRLGHSGRIDSNQALIVRELRKAGFSVAMTASVAPGFPDLVVGAGGKNFLFEVKDGNLSPSARKLTPDEKVWHESWRGQVAVIETTEEALKAMGQG